MNYALALKVHARYLDGFVCIELDEAHDLYDISFYLNKDFLTKISPDEGHSLEFYFYANLVFQKLDLLFYSLKLIPILQHYANDSIPKFN